MMPHRKLYRTFQDFLSENFGNKVQKISINAGFTCPNRDGSKGYGGCTYCNNQTFNPAYCISEKSVKTQLEEGIRFFARKYPEMDYLAYFQAYTNTYGTFDHLKSLYEEALNVPGVKGLVIGTRPDCMPDDLLEYLAGISKRKFVLVEFGVESTLNRTLKLINRGHDFECSSEAIIRTAIKGIPVGAHVIFGLPGESPDDIVNNAKALNGLPLSTIKLHQLQIIRGTKLAAQIEEKPDFVIRYSAEEYADMVIKFLENLKPEIAVERFVSQSPPELLISPDWGLKNYEFTHMVEKKMRDKATYQGRLF
jgi:uncharacterized protein